MAGGWVSGALKWLVFGRLGATRAVVEVAGGIYRRPVRSWVRALSRLSAWRRSYTRSVANWRRVWSWGADMASTLARDTLTKTPREARLFLFDFSKAPEVTSGETLSAPVVHADAGITVGTPVVTSGAFDGVPAGEGVKVLLSGGSAGDTYDVSCTVTTSGGATIEVAGRLAVVDPGT